MKKVTDNHRPSDRTSPSIFFGRCWGKFFCFFFGHMYDDVKCPRCLFVPSLNAYDNPVKVKERIIIHQECSPAASGGIEDYKGFIDKVREEIMDEVEKLNLKEDGRHGLRIVVTHTINTTSPKLRKKHRYFRCPSSKNYFV